MKRKTRSKNFKEELAGSPCSYFDEGYSSSIEGHSAPGVFCWRTEHICLEMLGHNINNKAMGKCEPTKLFVKPTY